MIILYLPLLCKPRAVIKITKTLSNIVLNFVLNFDDRNKQLECSLNHFQISIIQLMVLNPLLNCYEISTISNFDQAGEARSKF